MQISNGTATVTNGSALVVASTPEIDWSDVVGALGYGKPVMFSLLGIAQVPVQVIAAESPTTSASGNWELTLVSEWTGEDATDAGYLIHLDFTVNLGLALAAGGERQWAQLFSRNMEILDAAFGGIGTAVPAGVTTTIPTGRTLYVTGILDVPDGSIIDILSGAALEVG